MLWIYRDKTQPPSASVRLEDTPETWKQLLDGPDFIADEESKRDANVLCGAEYDAEEIGRFKENILAVHCMVLDVDCPGQRGEVPTRAALEGALEGTRAVVYASPSHTATLPRWRVLLPLRTPLKPTKYRALVEWLSANLVEGYPGCIDVESTGDPCRLGFVSVTKHPDDYVWWEHAGERFDWTVLDLPDEVWVKAPLGGMTRSERWPKRDEALKLARKHYQNVGRGLGRGEGRTKLLWNIALELWWRWAAEDEEFVLEVLRDVNSNFLEPEEEEHLGVKARQTHERTVGNKRIPQSSGPYGAALEPKNFVSRESINALAKRLKSRRGKNSTEDAIVGEALKRLAKGETLTDEPDTWHSVLLKCSQALASEFPSESAERIFGHFKPSLSTMRAAISAGTVDSTIPTDDEIQHNVESRLTWERRRKEENLQRADAKVREQIEYVTGGERDTKYTYSEVDGWSRSAGLRPNNWILVVKNAFYVFRNGTWVGPYTEKEFDAQGYKDLAAAADVGVKTQTYNDTKGQFVRRPLKDLLHDYGSSCETRCDMYCDKTYFDADEKVLVLRGPVRRDLKPTFHEEVDQWLRVMTRRPEPKSPKNRQVEAATSSAATGNPDDHDDYDVLCDWLACVPETEHPVAALYLQGKKSVGKGLFANGVGRIYKGGTIPLENAVAGFNALLLETPLLWVDEKLGKEIQASVLLRRVVAAREHVYTRKHQDSGKVTGCVRLMFTANNLDIFGKSKESLQKEDVDALALRFVHIFVNPEAELFLQRIAPRHEKFVEENKLAEHSLWLHEKRWAAIRKRGHRFLVQGKHTNVAEVVATNDDVTSECCNAICNALLEPGDKSDWCTVRDNMVYVNTVKLRALLSLQSPNFKGTDREVTRAIVSISPGGTRVIRHKKPLRMRPVLTSALRAWCENTDMFVWSEIAEAIGATNKAAEAAEAAEASKSAVVLQMKP